VGWSCDSDSGSRHRRIRTSVVPRACRYWCGYPLQRAVHAGPLSGSGRRYIFSPRSRGSLAHPRMNAQEVRGGPSEQAFSGSESVSQSGSESMNHTKPPTAIANPIPSPRICADCSASRGKPKPHLQGGVDYCLGLGISTPASRASSFRRSHTALSIGIPFRRRPSSHLHSGSPATRISL
jgi:hypothetical protein